MKNNLKIILLILTIGTSTIAQKINLNNKLPMDPSIKIGKLANGLTYYLKKNVEPKNRANLQLVIKAGSILEDDNQRGLAHFMEHMNFNGTKNFPKNTLVDFLQKSGLKFGADLNAHTSFDETVYLLPVPSDSAQKLEKFVSVLADWAGNALIDSVEVVKERGIILEESRSRKGVGQRISEKIYPVLFNNSKYSKRMPIGLDSIIANATPPLLKKFYGDWYRPDLQAFVAIGDFDIVQMEGWIKKYFGGFKNPKNARLRTKYSLKISDRTDFVKITDKEMPSNMVQLRYLQSKNPKLTGIDLRNSIIANIFNNLINQRLNEYLQKPNPPFLVGASQYSRSIGNIDELSVFAAAKGTDIIGALTTVLKENQRVSQFGFSETEIARAKKEIMADAEKQVLEESKIKSVTYANQITESFIDNSVVTNPKFDLAFLNQELSGISKAEINAFTKKILASKDRVVAVVGSEKDKDALPNEKEIKELINTKFQNLEDYVDNVPTTGIIDEIKNTGSVVNSTYFEKVDVTQLTLNNGVKVYLKPTNFKNDEIKIKANSWGGFSLYENADLTDAKFCDNMAEVSGIGNLKASELNKYMAGKNVSVRAIVGPNSEVISGISDKKDLATAFQMINARFSKNNIDTNAIKGFLNNYKDYFQKSETTITPSKVYSDTLEALMGNYNERAMPMNSEKFSKLNTQKSYKIFTERFSDVSDFVFTFVGNFNIDSIKPLINKYLGSLPTKNTNEKFIDRKISPPTGKIIKKVYKGTEDKANVTLIFHGNFVGNKTDELNFDALGEILNIKLTEKLREEEGNVYSPHVSANIRKFPSPMYDLRVGFGCAPSNVDKLINLTISEINKLKTNGAEKTDVDKYVSNEKLNFETNVKNNDFWIGSISSKLQQNEGLETILTENDLLNQLKPEDIKNAGNRYLDEGNLIEMILLPENK